MENKLVRDLFIGFIRVHILYHTSKEPVFGAEFKDELKRHGYNVSFGTLYPIFHKLERDGYITSVKKNVKGKIRKYYTITDKGREALLIATEKACELVDELKS